MSAVQDKPQGAPLLDAREISKSFTRDGQSFEAIRGIDLQVHAGEFVSIIGPSGCGKSTLFNIVAGLMTPDRGSVRVDGRETTGQPEACALMPQKDLLFPWRSVLANTTLGLEIRGMRKAEARRRAEPLFRTFGIDGTQKLYPFQLSGGMRQRAALLRTVIQGRPVMLLDEPFGALDSLTRTELQDWLLSVWQQEQWTVVLVTHDIREAIYLSDRVYVLGTDPGRVQEVIEVDLPRPRGVATTEMVEFAQYETRLTHALRLARAGRADD
ncbi:MAG: ABC transporter ATP-binding protein [Pseudodonghicola sp.]